MRPGAQRVVLESFQAELSRQLVAYQTVLVVQEVSEFVFPHEVHLKLRMKSVKLALKLPQRRTSAGGALREIEYLRSL